MKYHTKQRTPGSEQRLSTVLSVVSLVCGILAPVLICYWYVGMVLAVIAIGLGIYVRKRFGSNTMIRVAFVSAGLYVAFFVLLVVIMGIYYNMVGLF